jgi:nitroreductase
MTGGKEILDLIISRQSDRSYSDKPIEPEKLSRIIEAGRVAPSACNAQPWKFIIVNDPDLKNKIARAASAKILGMNEFVSQAQVIIVIIREKANTSSRIGATIKNIDYSLIDIGIAAGHMCLQAKAEGIGSCMIGWFDEKQIKKLLYIPAAKRVKLLISLGYPAKERREKKRKPLQEILSYNKY